jgi:NAD-dependent deacetylase
MIGVMHHKTGGSGAGISTDSGIPDFRGPQGVWTQNPKAQASSNIQNWVADAAVRMSVWESLGRDHVEQVPRPNPGHRALLALERRGVLTALVTQNVDGLHSEAGHLLVNLGKWVSGFSRFSDFLC